MRSRETIEAEIKTHGEHFGIDYPGIQIELLLDIRDLLMSDRVQSTNLVEVETKLTEIQRDMQRDVEFLDLAAS